MVFDNQINFATKSLKQVIINEPLRGEICVLEITKKVSSPFLQFCFDIHLIIVKAIKSGRLKLFHHVCVNCV